MRFPFRLSLVIGGAMALSACASHGIANRDRPDEFAVQRQAPLVVPPDFALVPPQPGAPRPAEGTAAQQALQALFGGPAPRSAVETSALNRAGTAEPGIRSAIGLVLCIAGLSVLVYPVLDLSLNEPIGLLLAFICSLSWGAGTIYMKWARIQGDLMAITFWQTVRK